MTCMPIVSVDKNESEKILCDGGTKIFTVKKIVLTLKQLLLEFGSTVPEQQNKVYLLI